MRVTWTVIGVFDDGETFERQVEASDPYEAMRIAAIEAEDPEGALQIVAAIQSTNPVISACDTNPPRAAYSVDLIRTARQ